MNSNDLILPKGLMVTLLSGPCIQWSKFATASGTTDPGNIYQAFWLNASSPVRLSIINSDLDVVLRIQSTHLPDAEKCHEISKDKALIEVVLSVFVPGQIK